MNNLPNNYRHLYFSADFHAYHKNICKGSTSWSHGAMRNFENPFDMTAQLVNNINNTVGTDDLLIHLGDWSFGGRDKITKFREQIKCEKVVNILGNHDRHIRKYKEYQDLFEWVGDYLEIKHGRKTICLCHYPMLSWNRMSKGAFMLYGHCHHNLKVNFGRMLDVGIDGPDYDFKPISLEYVYEKLINIPIEYIDHHIRS